MSTEIEQRLAVAHQLADISGEVLRKYFRQPNLHSQTKTGEISAIVTIADQTAEDAMVAHLQKKLPGDGVIREEGQSIPSQSGYTWVLDPIDGTSSFVRGLPIFGTLIGLVDEEMSPLLGLANQPITGDRWQGVTGEKSHINGVPIINPYQHQSIPLAQACLASTTPLMFTTMEQQEKVAKFYQQCQRTAFGGDCLNYLAGAAGWTAMALVILEADMNFYDFCALIPILAGADYCLSDWQGKPLTANSKEILASPNEDLHQQALQLLISQIG